MRSEQLRRFEPVDMSGVHNREPERARIQADVEAYLSAGGQIHQVGITHRGPDTYQFGRETDFAARQLCPGSTPRMREMERGRANSRKVRR